MPSKKKKSKNLRSKAVELRFDHNLQHGWRGKDATLIYPIIYWSFYSLSRLEHRCIWLRMIMRIELIGFESV